MSRCDTTAPTSAPPAGRVRAWAARFGAAAFVFFLVKGLLWLIVPAAIVAVTRLGWIG